MTHTFSVQAIISSRKYTYIILTTLSPPLYSKTEIYRYTLFNWFLFKNIDCGYLLESPPRGDSNEYPQFMFWAQICKISEFLPENFQFRMLKFLIYLNRRVCVMRELCIWVATSEQKRKKKKKKKKTCAPSEDWDQPVHSHSLVRSLTGRILNSQRCKVFLFVCFFVFVFFFQADNKDFYQTVWPETLLGAYARIFVFVTFLLIYNSSQL